MSILKKTFVHYSNSVLKRAPSILTGLGIGGFATSIVMGVKAAPDYFNDKLILDASDADKAEYAKNIGKHFWQTALVAGLSAGCIIFSDSIDFRRNSALAALCAAGERFAQEYQSQVIKQIGEKEHNKIVHSLHKDKVESEEFKKEDKIENYINRGHGDQKFIEAQCNQKFLANAEFIREAVNEFNARLLEEGEKSLNELYDELDLPYTEAGYILGWKYENRLDLIKVKFDAVLQDDKTAITMIDFSPHPNYDYRR